MPDPTIVHDQAGFDTAVAAGDKWIRIDSPRGVWIEVSTPRKIDVEASGSASVTAYGSASVTAYDSASVRAYDSASVTASGSASVRAYDSASVTASGSASVTAYDSASVRAYDSASVTASDSASVTAYGSASVTAYDSASVRAYDSASVTAYDSASVRAYDSASVTASDSASVTASTKVAVHLHSGRAHIDGGVLIDHTDVDLTDIPTWLEYKGITVVDGIATFYKAVDQQLRAGHGYTLTAYPVGGTVTAPDWNPATVCGGGLHATGDPGKSESYYNGPDVRCRYLELAVPVDGLVVLGDKVKFRTCTVVREVSIAAAPITAAVSS